jgi:hypothetical protein
MAATTKPESPGMHGLRPYVSARIGWRRERPSWTHPRAGA